MDHRPDIVSLMETRASDDRANRMIAKLGFQYSYQNKARGFSGRIWIGWKDSVHLEIIQNHLQSILTQVSFTLSVRTTLIAFIYGSPNKTKRRAL